MDETGYRTEAETFGFSAVLHLALSAREEDIIGQPGGTPWWFGVRGADWAHPGGLLSSVDGLDEHPVTNVSNNDALAYCNWAGLRLPTEEEWEWEYASRGGLESARYPLGERVAPGRGVEVQHLAERLPRAQYAQGRVVDPGAGPFVRAQRIRARANRRQRVGVVQRLVRPFLLSDFSGRGPDRAA